MPSDKIFLTRKIQLHINSNDPVYKKQVLDTLYRWQHMCFRGANYIFTHHFIQDQIGELFYINEGTKLKLGSIHKDADGVLTTSRLNTTYQLLSRYFKGQLPSDIYTNLNTAVVNQYNKEREFYWKGQKVLPNYKRDFPIPIKARSIKELRPTENGRDFTFTLFKLPFVTFLGSDKYDNKTLLEKIVAGSVSCCDSSIQLDRGKIFLLLTTVYQKEKHELRKDIIAEASLSIEYPVLVSIGNSKYRIGSMDEFCYRRLAIQSAMQRAQKAVDFNRSKNGRTRKFKSVTKFKNVEKNYVDHKLHVYSRRLIDICVKHKAATLILINQQDKEQAAKEDAFLLRNWSYFSLKEKIVYKAKKAGITVIAE